MKDHHQIAEDDNNCLLKRQKERRLMKGFHIQSTTVGGAEVISISVHLISPKKKDQKNLISHHITLSLAKVMKAPR